MNPATVMPTVYYPDLRDPYVDDDGKSTRVYLAVRQGLPTVVTPPSPNTLAKVLANHGPKDDASCIEDAEAVETVQTAHPAHRQEAIDFFNQHLDRHCSVEAGTKWLNEHPSKHRGDWAHQVMLPGGPLARCGLIDGKDYAERAVLVAVQLPGDEPNEKHYRNSALNALRSTPITENNIVVVRLKQVAAIMASAPTAQSATSASSGDPEGLATAAAAKALPSAFNNKQESKEWQQPRQLFQSRPTPPFQIEWLPSPLRRRALDIASHLSVPLGFVATSFYGWLGAAIGARCALMPQPLNTSWLVVPNVWTVLVARPSEKKSPVVDATGKHLERIAELEKEKWKSEVEGFEADEAIHNRKIKGVESELQKLASKNEDTSLLDARVKKLYLTAPKRPPEPFFIVGGFSPEALAKLVLANNPCGVAIHQDELVHALRAADPVLKPNDRALLLKLFSGTSSHRYISIAQQSVEIPHACASLIGTTQPASLAAYREELREKGNDGMLARLLFDKSAPVPYERPKTPMDLGASQLAQKIFEILVTITPSMVGASTRREEGGDGGLPFVRLTADAQPMFDEWYDANQRNIKLIDDDELSELLGKHDKRVAALALIHALTEWAAEKVAKVAWNPGAPWFSFVPFQGVSLESTKIAIALGDYYMTHAAATLDASAPTARLLRKFAERIIHGELQDGTTVGMLGRFGWSGVTPANALELCEALENLSWLELQHHRPAGRRGGRPSFKISVNPAVIGNTALLVDDPLASTGPAHRIDQPWSVATAGPTVAS